jgi:hypothetical protein
MLFVVIMLPLFSHLLFLLALLVNALLLRHQAKQAEIKFLPPTKIEQMLDRLLELYGGATMKHLPNRTKRKLILLEKVSQKRVKMIVP